MTQEELDALMKIGEELESGDDGATQGSASSQNGASEQDLGANSALNSNANGENSALNSGAKGANGENSSDLAQNSSGVANSSSTNAKNSSTSARNDSLNDLQIDTWSPPPPSNEHKVVHQLDEVTRDSEEKAIEMMDRLENIGKFFNHIEIALENIKANVLKNKETFTTLNAKFPHIQTFKTALEASTKSLEDSESIFKVLQQGQDEVFVSMDAMQYQDIHRQKIERAINVMRALNRYMNSLFEGSIDDSKRVSSAVHIAGDSTKDVMNDDDIEDLIASLRAK